MGESSMPGENNQKPFEQMNFIEKLKATGPAWMAAGLNIGGATVTNSVLLAAATGFTFGWVFLLATLAIFFATYACVQLTILTGKDPLSLISSELGSLYAYILAFAILLVNAVFFGVNLSLAGQVASTLVPGVTNGMGSTAILVGLIIFILLPGKSADIYVQKYLKYMIYALSVSYLASLFIVKIDWAGFLKGLFSFTIPQSKADVLLFTSVLGSALAVNVPAIQAYASKANGYDRSKLGLFRFETVLTNLFLLFAQLAVLVVVVSTLYAGGVKPANAIQASQALEPIAGKLSTILFCAGMFGATFSTVLAETSVAGFVISDVMHWDTSPNATRFKVIQMLLVLLGFIIPIGGWNPYSVVTWGGAFNATFMPVGIAAWLILVNRKKLMGEFKASFKYNFVLVLSLLISIIAAVRFWYVTLVQ